MKSLVVLFLCLLCLSGCHSRVTQIPDNQVSAVELFEARHADLPFPIDSKIQTCLPELSTETNVTGETLCVYTLGESVSFVRDFYREEMERWGWQELLASGSLDTYMFVFQKPGKRCVAIHIADDVQHRRSKKSRSLVSIFLQ